MFVGYISWHYSYAYRDGYRIFADGAWFIWRFFSFRRIVATLCHPLGEASRRGLFVRTVSRAFGFLIRVLILVVGALVLTGWVVAAAVLAVAWPFLPFVTAAGFVASVIGFSQYGV